MTVGKSFRFLTVFLITCLLVALTFSSLIVHSMSAAPDVRTTQADVVNWKPVTIQQAGAITVTPNLNQASLYMLAPTNTLTITLDTAGALPGDFVMFIGSVTTSTILADTGAVVTGTDRTIGDTDLWLGVFNGSEWSEISFADNQ